MRVAVIGGGVIGGGWAARLALFGHEVAVVDPDAGAGARLEAVLADARRALPAVLDAPLPAEGPVRLVPSVAAAVEGAGLVIEAVPERLEVKHRVYAEIEAVSDDVTIASSTSGLLPSDLQASLRRPDRLLVAHPFNPVYLLPLVELVAGRDTDPARVERIEGFLSSVAMAPLSCRDEVPGFLSDRLQEALWREALWLVHDGHATAEELDKAIALGPGLRWAQMGVMQTFHLAGGEGGMRAMLRMFGPCLKWPWTRLTEVPELTPAFIDRLAGQCEDQAEGRAPAELARIRDANLVAILRALKGQGWGAGQVLKDADAALRRAQPEPDWSRPIPTLSRIVPPDWTDYNGHMNESRYLQAVSDATDRFMELIGCDAAYIASGGSFFTAETHLRHLDEALAGDPIRATTQVLGTGARSMHLFTELSHGDGRLLATAEQVLVHVSLKTRRPAPPAPPIAEKLGMIAALHARLPVPEGVGRHVGQRR